VKTLNLSNVKDANDDNLDLTNLKTINILDNHRVLAVAEKAVLLLLSEDKSQENLDAAIKQKKIENALT
jgi:hypothetical protein